MIKANEIKVKVYPKDLKSIPDILPFNKLINGDPMELELNKKEIQRCMNFGDVYDLTSGEVLIDEYAYQDIAEFVEVEDETSKDKETVTEPTEDQKKNESTTTPCQDTVHYEYRRYSRDHQNRFLG